MDASKPERTYMAFVCLACHHHAPQACQAGQPQTAHKRHPRLLKS